MSTATLSQIHQWLEKLTGHPLHEDEGVMFGDPRRRISGVTVCWTPSPSNISNAAAAGDELILHHESLLFPYPFDHKQELNTLHWRVNRQRLQALAASNLVASRLHGTIDELWIYDEFAERLGLTRVAAQGGIYQRVFEIEPTSLEELVNRVQSAVGLAAARRTNVRPGRIVRKIGMPWGGMALFVNVHYMQSLIELDAEIDVMIAGETDNYGFRFCTEQGIDVIETSHEVSENAGLGRFADALRKQFPSLRVRHLSDECIWSA